MFSRVHHSSTHDIITLSPAARPPALCCSGHSTQRPVQRHAWWLTDITGNVGTTKWMSETSICTKVRPYVRYLFSQRTLYAKTNLCFRAHSERKSLWCVILYGEIIAVCSQIHTKHIKTLCGQNVELLNVKLVVRTVTTGIADPRKSQ
jgi:hypothetical protein